MGECDPHRTVSDEDPRPAVRAPDVACGEAHAEVGGRVTDASGEPLEGVWLEHRQLEGSGRIAEFGVITGPTGEYGHDLLGPGVYELTVVAQGYKPTTKRARLYAGRAEVVDFVLRSDT
jgi:hypothetical protein